MLLVDSLIDDWGIKMKICFLGDINSSHIQRWTKYFVEKNYDVYIVTLRKKTKLTFDGIKVFSIKSNQKIRRHGRLCAALNIYQFKRIINNIQPDLIHAHEFRAYGLLASWLNIHPMVISAWGTDVLIHIKKSKIQKYLVKKAIKNADLLHVDGIKTWKTLEQLGASKDKIVRIYFGIDTNNFNPKKRSNEFRDQLGIGTSPMIISTRQLYPIYDIETLIRAIPKVLKKVPDAKFVIGSSGSQNESLQKLAKALKVDKNTIFTGRISDSDFPHYIASSDIYVSTSLSDAGLASSTAEAMACGLPVIVTEDPDNREWIQDGVNGFIIPVKNPDILAEKIIKLAKNEKLREEMGKLNRKLITERNDFNLEMGKMEIEYKRLVNGN